MANEEKSIKIYRDFQFNFFSSLAQFDFPVFSFFCIVIGDIQNGDLWGKSACACAKNR